MKSNITYIILENTLLLSKKKYKDWKEIQSEFDNYKASLGPWSLEELFEYFDEDFKGNWPFDKNKLLNFYMNNQMVLFEKGNIISKDVAINCLKSPWGITENNNIFLAELLLEIHDQHYLFEKEIEILGRRCDCDDFLVYIPDEMVCCVVHLTWSGKKEKGKYPYVHFLYNFEMLKKKIESDINDYEE